MRKISETTPISSLGLLHLERTLSEVFLWDAGVPGVPSIESIRVGELVATALMPVQKVIQKLQAIVEQSHDIQVTQVDLQTTEVRLGKRWVAELGRGSLSVPHVLGDLFVAVGEPLPDLVGQFGVEPLMFQEIRFRELVPILKAVRRVIVISSDNSHAYSAAMQLRAQGIPNAYCMRSILDPI